MRAPHALMRLHGSTGSKLQQHHQQTRSRRHANIDWKYPTHSVLGARPVTGQAAMLAGAQLNVLQSAAWPPTGHTLSL